MVHQFIAAESALLLIDLQERLAAAMPADRLARVVNRTLAAIEGAQALGLPIVVTEQYPKGLGPTLPAIAQKVPGFAPVEKLDFSALTPVVKERLSGRKSVLVIGMETHVCVFQTVRALRRSGIAPFVAQDGVLSRDAVDFEVGLGLCRDAGAVLTTVEAALFDALGKAGGDAFKRISAAVK